MYVGRIAIIVVPVFKMFSVFCMKQTKAYKIIRELNEELEQRGYIVVPGKVSKRYFYGKVYINEDENIEDL